MLYGAFLGYNNPQPMNTVSAEEAPVLQFPKDLCRTVHDTIHVSKTDTIRDTVSVSKIKYKTKYRKVVVKDTVEKEVPVLYTRTTRIRKEFSPDTLLGSKPKKVLKEVIELKE